MPRDDVVGTVVLRCWPLDRFGAVSACDGVQRPRRRPLAESRGARQEADPVAGGRRSRDQRAGALDLFTAAVREVVVVVVMALALSFVVKTWLLQAFFIPSGSMEDTLLVGDRVIVSKLTPGPGRPAAR